VAGNEQEIYECDALVVGSGCAGMSAAVTAGHHGLNVLVVEKEPRFGGTTARSGGWLWIPGTSLARAWGIVEDKEQARTYLRHETGNSFDAAHAHTPRYSPTVRMIRAAGHHALQVGAS
jgi:succinate dehydrogenase/fumarate reductase flavoprotein subunit